MCNPSGADISSESIPRSPPARTDAQSAPGSPLQSPGTTSGSPARDSRLIVTRLSGRLPAPLASRAHPRVMRGPPRWPTVRTHLRVIRPAWRTKLIRPTSRHPRVRAPRPRLLRPCMARDRHLSACCLVRSGRVRQDLPWDPQWLNRRTLCSRDPLCPGHLLLLLLMTLLRHEHVYKGG